MYGIFHYAVVTPHFFWQVHKWLFSPSDFDLHVLEEENLDISYFTRYSVLIFSYPRPDTLHQEEKGMEGYDDYDDE